MKATLSPTHLRMVSWVSGIVLAVLAVFLVVDVLAAHRQAEDDEARLEEMEEAVRTDASVAETLDAFREQVTNTSLAREARNIRLGWIALAAAVLFVTSVKLSQRQVSKRVIVQHWGREATSTASNATARPTRTPPKDVDDTVDLAFVDEVIAEHGISPEAAIPILQALQTHFRYLPDEALRYLCQKTEITPAQVMGSATFYAQFRRKPVGEHVVRVCHGTACHVAGVGQVDDELRRQLGITNGDDTDPERRFTLEPVACLGCCSLAPVMMIGEETAGHLTPSTAWQALRNIEAQVAKEGAA